MRSELFITFLWVRWDRWGLTQMRPGNPAGTLPCEHHPAPPWPALFLGSLLRGVRGAQASRVLLLGDLTVLPSNGFP